MHRMSQTFLSVSFLLFTGFCITSSAVADDHYVTVDDSGFSPAALTIEVGDTVIWENVDDLDFPHTATSDLSPINSNYWRAFLAGYGDTDSHTFSNVGTFTYYDEDGPGTGSITVNQPSSPPAITLESPRLMDGQFLFEATGLTDGKTNVLSSSTDLTSWTEIATNVAAGVSMTFTNGTTGPHRFFRLTELP